MVKQHGGQTVTSSGSEQATLNTSATDTPVGIDQLSFFTAGTFLDLKTLARERGIDWRKYYDGLGQEKMAVPPLDEDTVTLAASAAHPIMQRTDNNEIGLVLFATESGVDQSKSAGLFVHGLLHLPPDCRVVELKQACYSGTAALRFACLFASANPDKKALVLASDIARYPLGSPGEPTQGCGAVAMLVAAHPRMLALQPHGGLHAQDVADFWRPNYRQEAVVDGKYSAHMYMHTALKCWERYAAATRNGLESIDKFCYHLPFTRMARKAHAYLLKTVRGREPDAAEVDRHIADSLHYGRVTGNSYTASMFQGLACLLDHARDDLTDRRIGFFSYGSGCTGEFLSGVVQPGYRSHLLTERHRRMLADRVELDYEQYKAVFTRRVPTDGGVHTFPRGRTGPFRLAGIRNHKRIYERVEHASTEH